MMKLLNCIVIRTETILIEQYAGRLLKMMYHSNDCDFSNNFDKITNRFIDRYCESSVRLSAGPWCTVFGATFRVSGNTASKCVLIVHRK